MKCINQILEDFYSRYAYLVYNYAWVFIIVPIALTGCLSTGLMFFNDRVVNDTYYIMTPRNGRYHQEAEAIIRNWPLTEDAQLEYLPGYYADSVHYFYLLITAKPGRGMMDNHTLDVIMKLDDFITSEFQMTTYDGSKNFTYTDICMTWRGACFGNGHVYMLRHRDDPPQFNAGPPKIVWPITRERFSDEPIYLGSLIGEPTLNRTDASLLDFKALRLAYFQKQLPKWVDDQSVLWRRGLQEYLKTFPDERFFKYCTDNGLEKVGPELPIHIAFGNEDTINQGLEDTAYRFAPQIVITVILILIFSYACSFFLLHRKSPKFIGVDWVRSKPLLAVAGIFEPGMAILSTVGLLFLLGMEFNCIVVVMPFLVLAIGVDDMFIMIAAWHGTKLTDPPEVRFSHALSDAAVSISITAITDVISFAIGTWNPLPGVQIFCCYTSVAMFFELIYQCTFYAAVMALVGKAECQGRHCVTFKKTMALEDSTTTFQRRFQVGTIVSKLREESSARVGSAQQKHALEDVDPSPIAVLSRQENAPEREDKLSYVQLFFRDTYGPKLLHPYGKIAAGILFVVYLTTAAWGCSRMASGLDPEKLVYKDHYSMKYLQAEFYWDNGQQIQVLLENPPNLTLSEEREKMLALVAEFENTSYTFGSEGTIFWLREYLAFLNTSTPVEDTQKQWCTDLKNWLKGDTFGVSFMSVKWGNESAGEDACNMTAFRFFIAAKQSAHPSTEVYVVPFFRNICDSYPEYKMSSYSYDIYPFTDQYLIINPITIRNSIVSFFVMICICLILIPHPVCGIFITMATVFIDVGVGGYLSWWGVNMDCVSMITMIMATGIAIDLAAHVSYAYVRAPGTPHDRAIKALESLGWPVFQGVSAMFLGVLVLATADSYMYQTFFKTVFLVIVFGLMHSIIFLPVALTVFAPRKIGCMKSKQAAAKNNVTPVNGVAAPTGFYENDEGKKKRERKSTS